MEIIGGKWKSIILCHLRTQTMRTSELERAIPQISQKMLVQQLRELEAANIVTRKVYQQVPPRVEYGLSDYGRRLSYMSCACGVRIILIAAELRVKRLPCYIETIYRQ